MSTNFPGLIIIPRFYCGGTVSLIFCPKSFFLKQFPFTILLFMQDDGGDDEKGVIVLRQYEDLEWLYHCLIAHNNVDGVVVS